MDSFQIYNKASHLLDAIRKICENKTKNMIQKWTNIITVLQEDQCTNVANTRGVCLAILKHIFKYNAEKLEDSDYTDIVLVQPGVKSQTNGTSQLSINFMIDKDESTDAFCNFVNDFTKNHKLLCDTINIPICLTAMTDVYNKHMNNNNMVIFVIYLVMCNALIEKIKITQLCKRKSQNIYEFKSMCFLKTKPDKNILSFSITFKTSKSDKIDIINMYSKALFEDTLCNFNLLLRYLKILNVPVTTGVNFFLDYYQIIFDSIKFNFTESVNTQVFNTDSKDITPSVNNICTKINDCILSDLICGLLHKSTDLDVVCQKYPCVYYHKSENNNKTDILLNTIFTCKAEHIVTKHTDIILIEPIQLYNKPPMVFRFANLKGSVTSTDKVIKNLGLDSSNKKALINLLVHGKLALTVDDSESLLMYKESLELILNEFGLGIYYNNEFAKIVNNNMNEGTLKFQQIQFPAQKCTRDIEHIVTNKNRLNFPESPKTIYRRYWDMINNI